MFSKVHTCACVAQICTIYCIPMGRDGHVQYLQRHISTNAHLCTTKGMSICYTVRATRNVIGQVPCFVGYDNSGCDHQYGMCRRWHRCFILSVPPCHLVTMLFTFPECYTTAYSVTFQLLLCLIYCSSMQCSCAKYCADILAEPVK